VPLAEMEKRCMSEASNDNLENVLGEIRHHVAGVRDELFECVVEPAGTGGSSAAAPDGPTPIGRAALRSRRARRGALGLETLALRLG
jgi:hypothetical protein